MLSACLLLLFCCLLLLLCCWSAPACLLCCLSAATCRPLLQLIWFAADLLLNLQLLACCRCGFGPAPDCWLVLLTCLLARSLAWPPAALACLPGCTLIAPWLACAVFAYLLSGLFARLLVCLLVYLLALLIHIHQQDKPLLKQTLAFLMLAFIYGVPYRKVKCNDFAVAFP